MSADIDLAVFMLRVPDLNNVCVKIITLILKIIYLPCKLFKYVPLS